MDPRTREQLLPWALRLAGAICLFGLYPLTLFWPSGWAWHTTGSSEYMQMIIGIYAVLGIFLLLAAQSPRAHLSLVSFAIWSSIVHGGIMAVQALGNPVHVHHLYGDVAALVLLAAMLGFLCPAALRPPR